MKRVALLPGGGAAGITQFGMVKAFLERMHFDAYYGISAGSLNSFGLCYQSVDKLEEIYLSLKSERSVIQSYYWVQFPWKLGLKNLNPTRKILEHIKNQQNKPHTPFFVASTDITNLKTVYTPGDDPDIIGQTIASCSIPGILEPYYDGKSLFVDGGVIEFTPLKRAIDDGADEIVIFLCYPIDFSFRAPFAPKNAIDIVARSFEATHHQQMLRDIALAESINKQGRKRYIDITVVAPNEVPIADLNYDPKLIPAAIDYGYKVGKDYLQASKRLPSQAS